MRWNKKGYKLYRNFEMQKKKKKSHNGCKNKFCENV